uniref:Uncharacterized protein n=1 Tax=Theropithecus gelada TaxID=9565 RepID=A0A8D2F5S5_THEGE
MSQVQGRGPTWAVLFMSKVGVRGDRQSEGDEVLDPLRQALDSSMQSHNLCQHPQHLAFHVSAPVASTMQQASGLLGLLPHLSSFALQPAHSLLPPLGSHGCKKQNGLWTLLAESLVTVGLWRSQFNFLNISFFHYS